jgi:hypothetical protein
MTDEGVFCRSLADPLRQVLEAEQEGTKDRSRGNLVVIPAHHVVDPFDMIDSQQRLTTHRNSGKSAMSGYWLITG